MTCTVDWNSLQDRIDRNIEITGFGYLPTTSQLSRLGGPVTLVLAVEKAIRYSGNPSIALGSVDKTFIKYMGVVGAYWAGVVIGSAAKAMYQSTTCTKEQYKETADMMGVKGGWVDSIVDSYPEILSYGI